MDGCCHQHFNYSSKDPCNLDQKKRAQAASLHAMLGKASLSCWLQDPTRRPTAGGLLQHGFLQNVQAPPSLQTTIRGHAARRAPLDQHMHQVPDYQQTMPRWNFGTESAAPEEAAHPKKGTLRSHQINMTFRDNGTVRHQTIPSHPSLAMMTQLAQAGLVCNCCCSCLYTTPLPVSCTALMSLRILLSRGCGSFAICASMLPLKSKQSWKLVQTLACCVLAKCA